MKPCVFFLLYINLLLVLYLIGPKMVQKYFLKSYLNFGGGHSCFFLSPFSEILIVFLAFI